MYSDKNIDQAPSHINQGNFRFYHLSDHIYIGRELRGATMHPPHNKTPLDFFEALGCPEHVINW